MATEAMMVTSTCVGWEVARASAPTSRLVIRGTKVTDGCVGWVVAGLVPECSHSHSCLLPLRLILSCDNVPCLPATRAKWLEIANIVHLVL